MPVKPVYHITMGKTLLFLCVPNLVPWLASPLTASQALQQDAPSNLVTVDRDYLDRVTLRRRLIEQKGSTVHGCLARGREAVAEVYSYLLKDHLPVRYPTMFRLSADRSVFQNKVTGKSFPADPPADCAAGLRALGETIEEDLFLLHGTPDGHLCVAFVCCFPAGFDPSAKMGRLLMDIHAPVPSYGKIGSSVERFFAKLQVGKSVKRLNVSLSRRVSSGERGRRRASPAASLFYPAWPGLLTRLEVDRANRRRAMQARKPHPR